MSAPRPVLGTALLAAGLAFAGAMTWGAISYSGPYRALAEWQLATFGGVWAGMTVIVPIMVVTCPLVALGLAIQGNGRGGRLGCLSLIAVVALGACALGAGLMMRAASLPSASDPVRTLDLASGADIGPGPAPVRLIGRADRAHALAIRWRGKAATHEKVYTPLVEPSGGPVRFVAVSERLDPNGPASLMPDDPQGILWPDGVPNEARAGLERSGVALAERAHLLDTSFNDPIFDWILAVGCTLAGVAGLVLFAVVIRPAGRG